MKQSEFNVGDLLVYNEMFQFAYRRNSSVFNADGLRSVKTPVIFLGIAMTTDKLAPGIFLFDTERCDVYYVGLSSFCVRSLVLVVSINNMCDNAEK